LYESLTRDVDRRIRGEHASLDHSTISRDFADVVARQFNHCGHLARFLHRGSPSQEPERVEHAVGSGNAFEKNHSHSREMDFAGWLLAGDSSSGGRHAASSPMMLT
jgi:hypothetical protein